MSKAVRRSWHDRQWRVLGNWEPKMFLHRRGDGVSLDVDSLWQEIHGDAAIQRLKTLGINLSIIHFHKGYGLQHEAASITEAKAWAQKLHAHGIRVGAYIGSTFFFETFDHPQYERMVMKNGHTGWSGSQYFRRYWCYNSPETVRYFEQVIRVAIKEVEADVLHFDNAFCYYLDKLCHCDYCMKGFRAFIRDEVPEIIEAAGYDSPDYLLPPPVGNLDYLATVDSVREPGLVAWALYHAEAGYRALKHFADYGRSLNPDIAILYNGANLCGITPFSRPHRELDALAQVDVTYIEDSLENPPGVTPDGMPISRFRPYKAAARTKTRAWTYTVETGQNGALMLAEAAVYSYQTLGCVETAMQTNHRLTQKNDLAMYEYLVTYEDLFLDRKPWHNIAVLRHHESMLLNPFPSGLTPYVVEQTLFEAHAPFTIISATGMTVDSLSEFDVLILPDAKCLSDLEAEELIRFVERGGRLLSIGNSGMATPINRHRAVWAFEPLFGRKHPPKPGSTAYEEIAYSINRGVGCTASEVIDGSLGKGRAIHIPNLQFQLPDKRCLTRFGGFDWYYHPYWRPPENVAVLLEALTRLLGEEQRVETDLARHVGMEYYRVREGFRIHVLNYRHPKKAEMGQIILHGTGLDPTKVKISWQTPSEAYELPATGSNAKAIKCQVPAFDLLGTLTLSEERNDGDHACVKKNRY